MRYTILLLLSCFVSCNPALAEHSVEKEFAKSLNPGDCARFQFYHQARHTFETSYMITDPVYYIMAKDATGLLVAQPHPECHYNSDSSRMCEYWFRSMEFDEPFLVHRLDKKVPCPHGIDHKHMVERLKLSHERVEFKVGDL